MAILNQMERDGVIGRYAIGFPDISPILAAMQRRRRALAALSWEEKIAIVDQMRTQFRRDLWKSIEPRQPPAAAETEIKEPGGSRAANESA